MSITTQLANDCIDFYNAVRNDPLRGRASSVDDYTQVLQRGYSSTAGGIPQRARTFLNRTTAARWGELRSAAGMFARQAGLGRNAEQGASDFLGVAWRESELDRRIGTVVLDSRPLRPTIATGFGTFTIRESEWAVTRVERWLRQALGHIGHHDFSRMLRSMKNFYREQVTAAKILYETAALRENEFPQAGRVAYFGHLENSPADVWGAYKVAVYPTQRSMGRRLSLSVLTGHDPYSNGAPASSAARSFMGSLWQGVTFGMTE